MDPQNRIYAQTNWKQTRRLMAQSISQARESQGRCSVYLRARNGSKRGARDLQNKGPVLLESPWGTVDFTTNQYHFARGILPRDHRCDLARSPDARSIHFATEFTFQQNDGRMNHCMHRLLAMPGLNPALKALFCLTFKAEFAQIYVERPYSPRETENHSPRHFSRSGRR